jgi:integral membrane protein
MASFFQDNVRQLRLIGLLEGVSLLVLLGVATPLKHFYGNPALVRVLGPIHGLLFLLFVVKTLSVGVEQRWKFGETTWKVLLACMVPFGTFYIDSKILSKISPQAVE